uniref:Uncharacterized protein n=1 Tax=Pipistrellus kuhlii TaxID=59472 RepID=A0A7J7UG42_PIPKU|nr:hypothetical protein mPipKuh1_009063 [Pipistrellus kuhlii]
MIIPKPKLEDLSTHKLPNACRITPNQNAWPSKQGLSPSSPGATQPCVVTVTHAHPTPHWPLWSCRLSPAPACLGCRPSSTLPSLPGQPPLLPHHQDTFYSLFDASFPSGSTTAPPILVFLSLPSPGSGHHPGT